MKKTSEELYKNYRVCALHFSQKMFLNDLQNRLQSNAVPIREHNIQEDITSCNITPNQCNYQERLELPLGKLLIKVLSISFLLYAYCIVLYAFIVFSLSLSLFLLFSLLIYTHIHIFFIFNMYSLFQLLSFIV